MTHPTRRYLLASPEERLRMHLESMHAYDLRRLWVRNILLLILLGVILWVAF